MNKRLLQILISSILLICVSLTPLIAKFTSANEIKPVQNITIGKYYSTIQEAIDDPETMDKHKIVVNAGTYFEKLIINKKILLIGQNPETTIIDGNGTYPIVKITTNEVTIENFTIKNSGNGPYGGIDLRHSNSCVITHNIIENCNIGIILFQFSQSEISFNNLRNTNVSIFLDSSFNNRILQNTVLESRTGIRIGALATYNTVEKNQIENCTNGVELGSQANYNVVINNYIGKNTNGVYFQGPTVKNCTFMGNALRKNEYGIEIVGSNVFNNSFVYNSFLFNNANVDSYWESYNVWDYGYPIGGNFWSDNYGADEFIGSDQNETGNDGISDTSYAIYFDYNDTYPLIGSFLGVTNVTIVKDTLYFIGYSANATIKEINFTERQIMLTTTSLDKKTTSFCKVVISRYLLNNSLENLNVLVNGQPIPTDSINFTENSNYISLYFIYIPSESKIPPPIPYAYIFGFLLAIVAFFLIVFRTRTISKPAKTETPEEGESTHQILK